MLIKAAKWLGVAPWDLAEQPTHWLRAAVAYADAEERARREAERDMNRRGGGTP